MKIRHLIAAASAAVLMSSVAMANEEAAQGSDESCATLQTKFDKDVMTAQSANVGQAQSLREQGAKLCAEGRTAEGVAKLKEALSHLSATKPAAPQS